MRKSERELMDRLQAFLQQHEAKRKAFIHEMVRDAWELINGESWLECLMLVDMLDTRLEVIQAVSDLHENPPKAKRGPRKVRL